MQAPRSQSGTPSAGTADPYALIDRAYRRLRERAADLKQGNIDPALIPLIKDLAAQLRALDLGEPAQEVMQLLPSAETAAPDSGSDGSPASASAGVFPPEPTAVPTAGSTPGPASPSGRVPGEDTAALIARNLALIEARADADPQWLLLLRKLAPHICVHRCRGGFTHASVVNRDGLRAWLPGFRRGTLDPALAGQLDALKTHRVLLIGLGDPITARIHQVTAAARDQPSRVLFLCDPEPLHWLAWMACADRSDVLSDERCMLLPGPDPAERYADILRTRPDLPPHSAVIDTLQRPPLKASMQHAADAAQQSRADARRSITAQIADRGHARSDADQAARLRPGAVILGVVSRFTTMVRHSMRDMAAACEAQGYRFRIIEEASAHEPHSGETIMRAILDDDPALIILINHLRHEYGEMFADVPMVTWVQDPVENILSPGNGAKCGPRDFLVGFYRPQCTENLGYAPDRFLSIPHFPVSSRIFHERTDNAEDTEEAHEARCDLVYVGHLHQTPEELLMQARARERGAGLRLIDGIDDAIRRVIANGRALTHAGAEMLVETVADEMGGKLEPAALGNLARGFAFRLYDLRFRIESLSWAAQWASEHQRTLHIHGRGWDRIAALAPHAKAPLEHGAPLRRSYQRSSLALQTIPTGFNHQRTFEALLSGCLPLVRYTPLDFAGLSIDEFRAQYGDGAACPLMPYTLGIRDLSRVVFHDSAELSALAERLLSDAAARSALREEFAAIVRERLSYDTSMPQIIEFVRAGLQREGAR